MTYSPDIQSIKGSPLGDSMNNKAGQWFSAEFKHFDEIADFMNEAKVNIETREIVWVNNRFYVLFLVDASARVRRIKKTKRKVKQNG